MYYTTTLLATFGLASAVSAHALVRGVFVNGVDQGDGQKVYIRSPGNNNPVKDLTSSDMACNVNGATTVPKSVSAAAGDAITFEWFHNSRGDDIIDGSHKGPIITYIAAATDGMDGTGPIWTKIAEEGFDASTKKWAVDKLIANKGMSTFKLPAELAAGPYLIRQEIIAHHESETTFVENPARGAQFYPACVQFDITGNGAGIQSQNFDINTGYTYSDPGIKFNLYTEVTSYDIPGPVVLGGGSGTSPAPAPAPAPTTSRLRQPTQTTMSSVVRTSTTAANPAPTSGNGNGNGNSGGITAQALYQQCGGNNWTGGTTCAESTCKFQNEWYSQCLN